VSCRWSARDNDRHSPFNQFGRLRRKPFIFTVCPTIFESNVSTVYKAGFPQAAMVCCNKERLCRAAAEPAHYWHYRLLRARRERPRSSRTAEQRYELPPFQLIELHSISAGQGRQDIELARNSKAYMDLTVQQTCAHSPASICSLKRRLGATLTDIVALRTSSGSRGRSMRSMMHEREHSESLQMLATKCSLASPTDQLFRQVFLEQEFAFPVYKNDVPLFGT
jgi:hypothetical protein